jgi:hypothetical protein
MNLPVKSSKGKVSLGVSDQKIGVSIHDVRLRIGSSQFGFFNAAILSRSGLDSP